MKKLLLSLLAAVVCGRVLGYDFADNHLYYTILDNDHVEVSGWDRDYGITGIVVPSTVSNNGNVYTVTSIGKGAFGFIPSPWREKSIESVELPSTLTTIGERAFDNCNALKSIQIPLSVTSIGQEAFVNCTSLTTIVIPNGVISIGHTAFQGCTKLSSVVLSNSITKLEQNLFYGCESLISMTIPSGVTEIGIAAFSNCTNLAVVVLPTNLTTIGQYAFAGCTSLSTISFPSKVTTIETWAFSGCTALVGIEACMMEPPTFPIGAFEEYTYTNAKLTVPGGRKNIYLQTDYWHKFMTIEEGYIPGDVNSDGLVNVTDIVATVNYIMEKNPANFNKAAADLNGDGEINVTDIVKMVSIIMASGARIME